MIRISLREFRGLGLKVWKVDGGLGLGKRYFLSISEVIVSQSAFPVFSIRKSRFYWVTNG